MSDTDRVVPFSNGSEYMRWTSMNCDRCTRGYDDEKNEAHCPIEDALSHASVFDDTIPIDLARRGGFTRPWREQALCPEFERLGDDPAVAPIRPLPGQLELFPESAP